MADNLAKPVEVHESNIDRPDLNKIAADEQKALEEELKRIEEIQAQETERHKEEAKKKLLSYFVQDRHGKVIKEKEINFDSSPPEVQSNVSTSSPSSFITVNDLTTVIDDLCLSINKSMQDMIDKSNGKRVVEDGGDISDIVLPRVPLQSASAAPAKEPQYGMPLNYFAGKSTPP
ncbi:unnamed protein product [Urochloa humidicola]